MAEGTVAYFSWRYGYITPDPLPRHRSWRGGGRAQPNRDIYVHASAVQTMGWKQLVEGQRVSYTLGSRSERSIVETMIANPADADDGSWGKAGPQAVTVTPLTCGDEASNRQRADALHRARGGRRYEPPPGQPPDLDPMTMRWPGRGVVLHFLPEQGRGRVFIVEGYGRGQLLEVHVDSVTGDDGPAALLTPGTPVAYRIGALTADQITARRRVPGFLQALDVTAVTGEDAERLRRTARTLVRETPYR